MARTKVISASSKAVLVFLVGKLMAPVFVKASNGLGMVSVGESCDGPDTKRVVLESLHERFKIFSQEEDRTR